MLVNADVKALELVCAAYLFNDKVMREEIVNQVDIHENNRVAFNLPTRLIAKTLVFRILYGGTEYAFVQDPVFMPVSTNIKYWKRAINNFYDKYNGIKEGHEALLKQVMLSGTYYSPVGRSYKFKPYQDTYGNWKWPRTNILNYPVQGFGADLMMIYRVSVFNKLRKHGLTALPIATVHDSVLLDVKESEVKQVVMQLVQAASDINGNFSKIFLSNFDLPIVVEIEVGNDYKNMDEYPLTNLT